MKIKKFSSKPIDINERIGAKPVVCYPNDNNDEKNLNILHLARRDMTKKKEIIIPPRDAKTFEIKKGEFFSKKNIEVYYPLKEMMIDNAAMIAWACYKNYHINRSNIYFKPQPRMAVKNKLY